MTAIQYDKRSSAVVTELEPCGDWVLKTATIEVESYIDWAAIQVCELSTQHVHQIDRSSSHPAAPSSCGYLRTHEHGGEGTRIFFAVLRLEAHFHDCARMTRRPADIQRDLNICA